MMKYLGMNLDEEYNNNRHTVALEGFQQLQPRDISVPGDFSSAAFLIAGALLCDGSLIKIKNVGVNPTRTGFLRVLENMGARIELENEREVCGEPVSDIVARYSELKAVTIGAEQIPSLIDEIPVIAVLATQATGKTRITGAGELRVKESDRLKAITVELTKMGAKIEELQDGLVIEGPVSLKGATVRSQGDHRIAMALAVAGLIADGETIIEKPECVSISFPNFFDTLSFFKK
jgi:3-phosphoshikimate 1-carboxyvinyltransferase